MKFHYYKITLQGEGDENYCFNYVEFHPFDVGDEFLDLGMNRFEEGKNDKNHDVPYKQITWSKTWKVNQSLILHVPEWIGPFGVLSVNVFSVDADYGVTLSFRETNNLRT